MVKSGYQERHTNDFDKDLCLDKSLVISFLKTTQPKEWKAIEKVYGEKTEERVLQNLHRQLDNNGSLHVIRKGFTDMGVKFQLFYPRPETSLNPTSLLNYQQNILSITRQVKYCKRNEKSIDLVLFLNGLPVATAELKNQFTGQNYKDAIIQYKTTREENELLFLFKKRAIVHFAVDADDVFLTTKIIGTDTYFLPFNKGDRMGKGNPLNPEGHKTDYLWREIWERDLWLEILSRFIHLEKKEYLDKSSGRISIKENVVFPRYHQLSAVRNLLADVRSKGIGQNYLIQHSAGSGKSNTIAWLAYRLSAIHTPDNVKVFDSVIVITDRKVLDTQLQNTIFNIEHIDGVVQKIDQDSKQLAKALKSGKHIIITTLQKFPFILEQAKDLPNRKYAVIIDEAHSSQSGDAHIKMKEALSKNYDNTYQSASNYSNSASSSNKIASEINAEIDENDIDGLEFVTDFATNYEIKQKNISFFAFTATPKGKTLAIFGTKGADDKPRAFHLYPMRQAIEEGFILDVLKNYTTYEVYWKITKKIIEDPELNKKQTKKSLGKFVALNEHNIEQKTGIILQHFNDFARKKIGGLAKAMVVTGSRLQAVLYFEEFKKQIKENNWENIRALVAFSGEVQDETYHIGTVTESSLNGFGEKELPNKFESEYNILLVAEKYQTGFDQPLLQTMYIDKKISGVKAVQTLSRLNRMHIGKDETFVLDFVNDYETIKESFQPYYEATTLTETPNPNLLYDLKNRIYESQIIWDTEVVAFAKVYFKSTTKLSTREHAQLSRFIDPAAQRFLGMLEEKQDNLENTLEAYLSMFTFLNQLVAYQDRDLEILYPYIKFLLDKINKTNPKKGTVNINEKVALEYYRVNKITEGNILLAINDEGEIIPPTEAGLSKDKEEKELLSKIIDLLNNQFNTDFTEADALTFDQYVMDCQQREDLREQAQSNNFEGFMYGFDEVFLQILLARMDINQEIFNKIMDNERGFGRSVKQYVAKKTYENFVAERVKVV